MLMGAPRCSPVRSARPHLIPTCSPEEGFAPDQVDGPRETSRADGPPRSRRGLSLAPRGTPMLRTQHRKKQRPSTAGGGKRRRRFRLNMELLEERCVLDAGFYSITGVGNNLAHPNWGSVGQDLLRVAPAAYGGDGSGSVMGGQNRLSPREISDII